MTYSATPRAVSSQPADASPQQRLATLLDQHAPRSLLLISQSGIPVAAHWCEDHHCTPVSLTDPDPLHLLADAGRFDLAIIADQLEYMNHHAGEELIGRVRNLHTDSLIVLYQPLLTSTHLRWELNDFLGMGLRKDSQYQQDDRAMMLFTYELNDYNFTRSWNNPDFWANPENWGKYWW